FTSSPRQRRVTLFPYTTLFRSVVDEHGTPTGQLREPTAYNLLFDAAPARSHDDERDALRDMLRTLAAAGLTGGAVMDGKPGTVEDRKSTRLNSSHVSISYAVFC